ncbi:hypothetical protein [Paraliomyxa miuraensis]|uniref:hypothetical protein n=1 Tax=Paraliomyxa miuraensis TaxID=376150 RepID=UPI00224D6B7E|nr:hypothetical protein [Paraliomyxa miuraensis]MCX4245534.1 hypothetical protein [Paraliomyxa miuraensis]
MLLAFATAHALGVLLATQQLGLGFDARVRVSSPPPLRPGAQGELSVTILDAPEMASPPLVRLSSTGVILPQRRLGEADVVDLQASQPRIRTRFFAPQHAGRYEVQGLVEYVTCEDDRCRPRRARVKWVVEVTAPPADPP